MALFGDYLDTLSPFTDWVSRAQDELALAVAEGMPRTQVLTLQNQVTDASRRDDQAAARDVYNVVARWRSERGNRGAAPGDDTTPTVREVVAEVADRAAGAADTTADILTTTGRNVTTGTRRAVAATVEAVAGGAADGAGSVAARSPYLTAAVAVGGVTVALLALGYVLANVRALKSVAAPAA